MFPLPLIVTIRPSEVVQVIAPTSTTLPLASRGILAAAMLAFARALGDFGATLMVAGNIPGRTQTAAIAIYDATQGGRDSEALALVLVLSLAAFTLLYATNRLTAAGLK